MDQGRQTSLRALRWCLYGESAEVGPELLYYPRAASLDEGFYAIVLSVEREDGKTKTIFANSESIEVLNAISLQKIKKGDPIKVYLDDDDLCVGAYLDERCLEEDKPRSLICLKCKSDKIEMSNAGNSRQFVCSICDEDGSRSLILIFPDELSAGRRDY